MSATGRTSVMTHDYHLHMNWKHAIGMGEGASPIVQPVRSTFRDWREDAAD